MKLTTFKCSYCGYQREAQEGTVIYCGPHVACLGGATYPKVRMKPKPEKASSRPCNVEQ